MTGTTLKFATIVGTFVLLSSAGALAESESGTSVTSSSVNDSAAQGGQFETPVGIGTLLGDVGGHSDYGMVVEAQNHFKQERDMYGLRRYGQGESRLLLGNGVGVSLSAISGITLYEKENSHSAVSPQIGVEPMSGGVTWDSNGNQENYYEWLPAVSAGVQFRAGNCKILPLLRGGGAVGTITKNSANWVPTLGTLYGAGTYLNCNAIDLSADALRIGSQGIPADLDIVDVAYNFSPHSPNGVKIGLRGENLQLNGLSGGSDHSERRILLVLRTRLSD